MARIHRLPLPVINAIAAGETIERPAYVVKELIENALDAGATQIEITFTQAGLEHIRVHDNGHGMDAEDLALAALPHTTSKISQLNDLHQLSTFGFRGEALASMGKVALVTIGSRTADCETGHVIQIHHGNTSEVSPQAMTVGTTVVVEGLFQHVPVRKKFLTNLQKERRLIMDVVSHQALSNPEVGFQLRDGLKMLIDLPRGQDLSNRLSYLLEPDILEHLVPIHFQHSYLSLTGYIGTPQLARKHGKHQYFFLNHRVVSYPLINTVMKKAYGSLLQPGFSPWFLLNVRLPSGLYDANIHPRKETVAFLDESQLVTLINQTVVETLSNQNLRWQFQPPNTSKPKPEFGRPTKQTPLAEVHRALRQNITPWSVKEVIDTSVLQIDNTYLLYPDQDGFTLVDQHAAHERILYEQFKEAFEHQPTDQMGVPVEPPHVLNLSVEEDLAWQEQTTTLRQIGFNWEAFGPNSYAINQIPANLHQHDLDLVIPHLLDDLIAQVPIGLTNQAHRTLAYLACRSAVMAGDPLSTEEALRLINQLNQTKNNATCPHGRPTRIHFGKDKLEKLFGRR